MNMPEYQKRWALQDLAKWKALRMIIYDYHKICESDDSDLNIKFDGLELQVVLGAPLLIPLIEAHIDEIQKFLDTGKSKYDELKEID